MARAFQRRRTYRWTMITFALLLGALGAIGVLAAARAPAQAADARLDAFRSLGEELRTELDHADRSLDHGMMPERARAARLAVLADELTELSSQPDPWPVVVDTGHGLDRIHDQGFAAAAAVYDAAARLTAIQRYTAGATQLAELPALPSAATGPEVAEIDAALTVALATAGARVAALPDVPAMQPHRTAAFDTLGRLAEWREPYLEALRNGLPDAADRVAEAEAWIADLEAILVETRAKGLVLLRDHVRHALVAVDGLALLTA